MLFSVKSQHESAIGMHISLLSMSFVLLICHLLFFLIIFFVFDILNFTLYLGLQFFLSLWWCMSPFNSIRSLINFLLCFYYSTFIFITFQISLFFIFIFQSFWDTYDLHVTFFFSYSYRLYFHLGFYTFVKFPIWFLKFSNLFLALFYLLSSFVNSHIFHIKCFIDILLILCDFLIIYLLKQFSMIF